MHDLGPLKPGAFVRIFHHGRHFTTMSLLAALVLTGQVLDLAMDLTGN